MDPWSNVRSFLVQKLKFTACTHEKGYARIESAAFVFLYVIHQSRPLRYHQILSHGIAAHAIGSRAEAEKRELGNYPTADIVAIHREAARKFLNPISHKGPRWIDDLIDQSERYCIPDAVSESSDKSAVTVTFRSMAIHFPRDLLGGISTYPAREEAIPEDEWAPPRTKSNGGTRPFDGLTPMHRKTAEEWAMRYAQAITLTPPPPGQRLPGLRFKTGNIRRSYC